jgi:hypothetical protein
MLLRRRELCADLSPSGACGNLPKTRQCDFSTPPPEGSLLTERLLGNRVFPYPLNKEVEYLVFSGVWNPIRRVQTTVRTLL